MIFGALSEGHGFNYRPSHAKYFLKKMFSIITSATICRVIGTTFFEGRRVSVFYPAGYVYMVFLWALFGLHLMWSYFIVKILFVKLRSGQVLL